MAVRELTKLRFEFLQKYSNEELYTLIFTDYKKYPTELVKVLDLETLAKQTISQIIDILGIARVVTIQDFFQIINQLREQVVVIDEGAPASDLAGSISDADLAAGYTDSGGGGG